MASVKPCGNTEAQVNQKVEYRLLIKGGHVRVQEQVQEYGEDEPTWEDVEEKLLYIVDGLVCEVFND